MSFRDPASNQYVGFDVDLVTKLAEDMGVQVEFVPTDWKSRNRRSRQIRYFYKCFAQPSARLGCWLHESLFPVADVPLVSQQNGDKFKDWDDLNQRG